jgi:putative nucleotidyltransferase with HDIG domain
MRQSCDGGELGAENWLKIARRLPAIPAAVEEALRLLDGEAATCGEVARALAKDEVMAARVLRVVNSAFYGSGHVGTLSNAVLLLGFAQVRALVLGLGVFWAGGAGGPRGAAAREALWGHSLRVAQWAQVLARRVGCQPHEEAFLGGLLHDLGKTALVAAEPARYSALGAAKGEPDDICARERAAFGIDHPELGLYLAQQWRFPLFLCQAIALHHAQWPPPLQGDDVGRQYRALAIVRVANAASRLFAESAAGESPRADEGSPFGLDDVDALLEPFSRLVQCEPAQATLGGGGDQE